MKPAMRIALIACIAVIALLIVILVMGIQSPPSCRGAVRGTTFMNNGDIAEEISVSKNDVKQIELLFAHEEIEIRSGDGDEVSIVQEAGSSLPEEYRMRVGIKDGLLFAHSGQSSWNFTFFSVPPLSRIIVTIPEGMAVPASIETASGRIQADGVQFENVDVATASGGASFTDVRAKRCEFSGASGDIDITGASEFDELTASLASGGLYAEANVSGDVSVGTASGRVRFYGSCRTFDANTASGDVEAACAGAERIAADTASGSVDIECGDASLLKEIEVETMSGSVTLMLPSGTAIDPEFDTASGAFEFADGLIMGGSGAIPIDVSTASGDLTIRAGSGAGSTGSGRHVSRTGGSSVPSAPSAPTAPKAPAAPNS